MTDIVILTEEPSAVIVIECLAQTLKIADRTLVLQHQGKSDLEASFPRKIRAWRAAREPRFVIVRDNDGADCRRLKRRLLALTPADSIARVKIRLVVQELESWYLGDPDAVCRAGLMSENSARDLIRGALLRDPDGKNNAKQLFKTRISNRGQLEHARLIGPNLNPDSNRSKSFHAFINALRWAAS